MKLSYPVILVFLLSTLPVFSQPAAGGGNRFATVYFTFLVLIGVWVGGFFILRLAVKQGAISASKAYFGERPRTSPPGSFPPVAPGSDDSL